MAGEHIETREDAICAVIDNIEGLYNVKQMALNTADEVQARKQMWRLVVYAVPEVRINGRKIYLSFDVHKKATDQLMEEWQEYQNESGT